MDRFMIDNGEIMTAIKIIQTGLLIINKLTVNRR